MTGAEAERYRENGWWSDVPVGERVRQLAASHPEDLAYVSGQQSLTWAEYDAAGDRLAGILVGLGLQRDDRVAVYLPDGPWLHAVYLAAERAGVILVGIPERAGDRELVHLVTRTGAELLVCPDESRGRSAAELARVLRAGGAPVRRYGVLDGEGELRVHDVDSPTPIQVRPGDLEGRQIRPDELWLLNSTSGTTGVPKCVKQTQNRWLYLVNAAARASGLGPGDTVMSLVPGPFGFGLWSAHFAPAVFGIPCVLQPRFDAAAALRAVAEHRVTVLACVTTQFQLMLSSPAMDEVDLSSLRVLYTGGEAVGAERAREWERRTGSKVLQFYGSNEIGPFSCTSLDDPDDLRLGTVGRVVEGLELQIYDDLGQVVAARTGQPGARSPGTHGGGYWEDEEANQALVKEGGYFLMPDIVTIDEAGYVTITGRKSDIIIRGGKNISAAAVEADVARHPSVDMVAAVPVADDVFGERVCAVVSLRPAAEPLTLDQLVAFLGAEGVGKEYFPEYLVVLDELPQSMGGKIAKAALKARLPELISGA